MTGETAATPVAALPAIDWHVSTWQGCIAAAAQHGEGLDTFTAALEDIKQRYSPDWVLLGCAKREILDAAEHHLADMQDPRVLDAIYFGIFPEDATQDDNDLDGSTVDFDDREAIRDAIKWLVKLPAIDYARQREPAAKRLGITLKVLDAEVKAARAENGDTKGQGRPLKLPMIEPWPDAINGSNLLDDICDAIERYLVLPDGGPEILALWAIHTHVFNSFEHSPRLAITSPEKGCGKTTTLDILGELVARPLSTSNATTSAIFRTIEKVTPTLLIDEADTFLKDNEELRGVLNAGHRRGGQIIRTVGDDYEPRQFSTWTPAAIAMIGRLPDTLEDRSVSIVLRRRRPTERVQPFRCDRAQDLKQIARKIARWMRDNRVTLAASDPATGMLVNRPADNWRPLLAIADLAGGEWPKRARAVAEVAETAKPDQSKRIMALRDIRDFFAARPEANRVRSAELAAALGAMENHPWSEWRNGKSITPAALARLLAPFVIIPGTHREGANTFKGYLRSDFAEAFAAYLPDQTVTPSQPNNGGRCEASQTVTLDRDVTLSKVSQPNSHGHCDGVTVQNGVKGLEDVNGHYCDQCQQPGAGADPLLDVYDGEHDARLHRGCLTAWKSNHVPQFTENREV